MESLKDIFKKHKTDKIDHNYHEIYSLIFNDLRDKNINLLEIGVFFGLSHLSWGEYFKNSNIYGIDIFHPHRYSRQMKCFAYRPLEKIDEWDKIKPNINYMELCEWYKDRITEFVNSKQIKLFRCSQSYIEDAPNYKKKLCNNGLKYFTKQIDNVLFDIIIDDGSHCQSDHQISLGYLFKWLKPGGIYVIEDAQFEKHDKNLLFDGKYAPMTIDLIDFYIKEGKFNSPCIDDEQKKYLEKNIEKAEIHQTGKKGQKLIVIYKSI